MTFMNLRAFFILKGDVKRFYLGVDTLACLYASIEGRRAQDTTTSIKNHFTIAFTKIWHT